MFHVDWMKARILKKFGKYGLAAFIIFEISQIALGLAWGIPAGLATWAAMQH